MRILSLTFFLFFNLHFSAQILSQNQKLESLCRIWGFLKYYHPNVAKGNFEWDQQLLRKISEVESVHDKTELNVLYLNWIESLGQIDICKPCSKEDDKTYFEKNLDLSWMSNSNVFNAEVSRKLHNIQNNRNTGTNHYLGKSGRKVYFRNENSYGSKFTSTAIGLLELFRYWNYVEYFFPYKYQTDQNWNDTLTEMIPKFLAVSNDETYHLALAELVTKTDDSHAFLYSTLISLNQYGNKKVPVEYLYAEGKLVITRVNATRFNESVPLYAGDVIYDIDGRTIPQIINSFGKYIPASNSWGKEKKAKNLFLFSNRDSMSVKVERNGQNISVTAKTYFIPDIIRENIPVLQKWKFMDNKKKTGYVNMGIIEQEDLGEMYSNLKSAESIIFDLRNYPKQTIIPLSHILLPGASIYYQFTFPDISYPGRFYSRKNSIGKKNKHYYKGNVIILVDENTQSQAETTTMMLKQHPKSTVIGSNTSGANGDIIRFKIADLETCFTGLGAYYPDGRETQRIGIVPDIIVKPTINGIKKGMDEVLERALLFIKTNE